jgi:uncharacterized membrane protein
MFNNILSFFTHKDQQIKSDRAIFITILVTALLSLLASLILSVDALTLASNPDTALSCNINALINCATVANSSYSQLFGFPNSYIGMMSESVFITVAVAGLFGTRFPRHFMCAVQILAIVALVFAFYLLFVSSFIIQVFCPWCLLVDVCTIIMFFAIVRHNFLHDYSYLPNKITKKVKVWMKQDFDKLLAALIIVVIAAAIIVKYGSELFA